MTLFTAEITNLRSKDLSTAKAHRGDPTVVIQQYAVRYSQADGTQVASATVPIHIAYASGTILAVEAMLITNCKEDPAETVTVDIQKGNAGGAYATILDEVISFSVADADREVKAGVLVTTTYSAEDSFIVIVTVTNPGEAQGLVVNLWLREHPAD